MLQSCAGAASGMQPYRTATFYRLGRVLTSQASGGASGPNFPTYSTQMFRLSPGKGKVIRGNARYTWTRKISRNGDHLPLMMREGIPFAGDTLGRGDLYSGGVTPSA